MKVEQYSITQLRSSLLNNELSPEALLTEVLERIRLNEPMINGYIRLAEEEALRLASSKLDLKLPLAGIPIAVKDNIAVKGMGLSCGSRILDGFISPYDATAVARLKAAGAVVIGKTNLDEFAMGSSNETSYFGPVRNPLDHRLVPGGSSGGSAAVVNYGGAVAALGSDTGGSVRQPAAFCGVVGFKPTYGRVSRYGLVAFASSLDVIGPITRTVEDAGILFSVIAGQDPKDATSVDRPIDFLAGLKDGVQDLVVGVAKEYFPPELDPQVRAAIEDRIERLSRCCRDVCEVSLPHTGYAVATYQILAMAEASSNLARYDGVRYGYRADEPELGEMYEATRGAGFGAEVKRRVLLGSYVLSRGYYDEYYLVAQRARTRFIEEFEQAFSRVDLILTPTTPSLPFRLGEKARDPLEMYLSDVFTTPASLAGLSAVSVPVQSPAGLPVGLQLIGPKFEEGKLLRLAYVCESL